MEKSVVIRLSHDQQMFHVQKFYPQMFCEMALLVKAQNIFTMKIPTLTVL